MTAVKITRILIVLSLAVGLGLGITLSLNYSPLLTALLVLDLLGYLGLCVLADKLVHSPST